MEKSISIRTGRHCVYNLHAHLVFVAKYRYKIFDALSLEKLKDIFSKVCNDFESELIEINGENDHIHLLINYPPKISISKLVNSLKGVSSRRLRQECPRLAKYYFKGVLWSPSYFVGSCGGAPISVLEQYIRSQNTPTT